jgi:hypothetical protein
MKDLVDRAIDLAKSAVIGYLVVLVVCLSVVMGLSAVALGTGASSLNVAIGPLPIMSFWNSAAGYGFQSEWGVAVVTALGAAAGLGLGFRRQLIRAV